MSAENKHLDPEIAGLLRETSRRGGLAFLNRPLNELPGYRQAYRRRGRLRASSAEKHLLKVYREEVAWLLRRASVSAMHSNPDAPMVRCVGPEAHVRVISTDELRQEQAYLERVMPAGVKEEIDALSELARLVPVQPKHAARLATASLTLVHRADALICLSLALHHERESQLAKRLLGQTISSRPIAMEASIGYNNLGLIHHSEKEWDTARQMFRTAALEAPNPAPTMSWLVAACIAGDWDDAFAASSRLEEIVPPEHPALEEYIGKRLHRTTGSSTLEMTRARLLDRVGPAARKALQCIG